MKLHYKKEHTSCTNYKSESYEGFGIGKFTKGDSFNSQTLSVKTNFLIFILAGEVEIVPKGAKARRAKAKEFFFISALSTYEIQVRESGRYIYMSFLYSDIKLCEKYMLESYLKATKSICKDIEILPVRHPLNLFLELMEVYLKAGVNCKHLHAIKEKEVFIILRTSYNKQEIVNLFHEIIGMNVSFKAAVLLHADYVNSRGELAQAMGMSITDLARKFKMEFGESVYSWLMKQKNKRIISQLSQPKTTIKEIVYEFGFSSAASFNKYCKKNFGNSPRELVKQLKDNHTDRQKIKT